jgi:hypothetical protein
VNALCPFCGNKGAIDTLNYTSGNPGKFRVQCQGCLAATHWCDTEGEAWEAWSARPRPSSSEQQAVIPGSIFIAKDLFFHKNSFYARNPQTGSCYIGEAGGNFKRVRKADFLLAYAECAKAAGKLKETTR